MEELAVFRGLIEKYISTNSELAQVLKLKVRDEGVSITLTNSHDEEMLKVFFFYFGAEPLERAKSRDCFISIDKDGTEENNLCLRFEQLEPSVETAKEMSEELSDILDNAILGNLVVETWKIPLFGKCRFVGLGRRVSKDKKIEFLRPGWFTRKFGKRISVKEFKPYVSDM